MNLEALADSLAPTTVAPATDQPSAKPRRAPRALDAPPTGDAPVGSASRPEPGEPPPAAASSAPGTLPAGALDALLAGPPAELGAWFAALAEGQLLAERRAVLAARQQRDASVADGERASLTVQESEAAFLVSGSADDHARTVAARAEVDRLRDLAGLQGRALAAREGELEAAQRRLARQAFDAVLARLTAFPAARLAPVVDRFWSHLVAVRAEVDALAPLLAERRALVGAFRPLAMMAGVDLARDYATDPRLAPVVAPNGRLHAASFDDSDLLHFVQQGLRERVMTAGDRMQQAVRWLRPWGMQ